MPRETPPDLDIFPCRQPPCRYGYYEQGGLADLNEDVRVMELVEDTVSRSWSLKRDEELLFGDLCQEKETCRLDRQDRVREDDDSDNCCAPSFFAVRVHTAFARACCNI